MSNALPTSDPIRKRLYAFPRMVADLLRSLFADEDLGADYDTLERLPAEYVGNAFQQRRGGIDDGLEAVLVLVRFLGDQAAFVRRVGARDVRDVDRDYGEKFGAAQFVWSRNLDQDNLVLCRSPASTAQGA